MPRPLQRWLLLQSLVLLLAALLLAMPSQASDLGDRSDRYDRDPPTRVARVAELDGRVLWYDAEQRDWQPLLRNQTLAEGDRLRVEEGGRVGLRIGAHGLWLAERSELEIRRLDEGRIDLDLESGTLALRWLTREAAQDAQVRTREGRVRFERAGAYRVDQRARATQLQAFEGRLRFDHRGSDAAPFELDAPEQAELWWDNGPRAERARLLRADAFGEWLVASLGFGRGEGQGAWRERTAYRYVSPELTGADELDAHGRWDSSAEFGPLWIPVRVAVDWAPFRHGRWLWTRHWGWTWVDDLPWGYATSHYGRWVHWRGRWCWAPGSVISHRPVFAPALVTWIGHGGVQVGVQIGSRWTPPVAWYPLAPYESYRPWFRHSPGYVRRIDPDPQTVRRPIEGWSGHNRSAPGAVSTLAQPLVQAGTGPQRPVPLREDLRQWAPLPQGPGRTWKSDAPRRAEVQGTHPTTEEAPRVRAGGGQGLPLRPSGEAVVAPSNLPAPAQAEARREPPRRGEPRVEPRQPDEPRRAPQPLWPSGERESVRDRDGERMGPSDTADRAERAERAERFERSERLRREREHEPDNERSLPWRSPAPIPDAVPPRRMETPPQPIRSPDMPMRRIEVPRAEPARVEAPRAEAPRAQPPRRARDNDEGPRRGNEVQR
jgi:hypothetical protein